MAADAPLLDVYLIGAKDKSPSAQMRLVGAIAARYRLSAPLLAEALEGAPCRVAAGLAAPDAQNMADDMTGMGALVRIVPAGASADAVAAGGAGSLTRAANDPLSMAPLAPRSAAPRMRPMADDPLAPLPKDVRITLKSTEVETPLLVNVSEPIEFAEPGPEGKTGVRGSDTTRCPIHGLVYNRRKASGCLRCLAPARAQARKLKEAAGGGEPSTRDGVFSPLRDNPVRRAFWGLAFALVLGFLPAAYYARSVNGLDVLALRGQQLQLSSLPATRESLARFDALDASVDQARRHGVTRTLLIWVVVGGIAGLAWTRLTRPSVS